MNDNIICWTVSTVRSAASALLAVAMTLAPLTATAMPGYAAGVNAAMGHAGLHDDDESATIDVLDLPAVKLEQAGSFAQILQQIENKRVVFVGETHTRYDHHLVQLETLKHLYRKSPDIALGVEWFQQPFQQHLDDFIAGNITEQEMLRRTEYYGRWNYDYRLYRPIMQYARDNKIPVIALNASRELVRAVVKTDFDELSAELKQQLPQSYDWSDEEYANRLRAIYASHPEGQGAFEGFLRGQLTWDESMAERAAEYLQDNPDQRMLILAGSGHIMHGSGIPNRLQRRIEADMATILATEDYLPMSRDIADYIVLSVSNELEPVGLIGALLTSEGKLLVVGGFSQDSAIKDAGLKEGAVIIGVDDTEVESLTDYKFAVMDKRAGDTIQLHYLEDAEEGSGDKKSIEIVLR